jgi:SHS2 domain-containing protein
MVKFKFLEHTADIKFQAFGKTLEEAFKNSALAMANLIFKGKVKGKISKKIKVSGKDNERLLYEFLEEILVLLDSEDFILSKIKSLKIKDNNLKAEVIGDKASDYNFSNQVKAVTYNEMFVKMEKDKYATQVVLDV